MRASLDKHQIAVYEHKDKPHPHIHIYINRVTLDGGPALRTDQNYARNVKATQQIRQELGMTPLPEQRQSLRDHSPDQQATRERVQAALRQALLDQQVRTPAQLQEQLQQQGIETRLKVNEQGTLVGVSFRAGQVSVTGTEVGYKAQQLRTHFAGLAAPRLVTSAPTKPVIGPPTSPAHLRAADAQQQQVRQYVHHALTATLQQPEIRRVADLGNHLVTFGIRSTFKRDAQGLLVGASFRYQQLDVKGTEVGYKAQQLREQLVDEPHDRLRTRGQDAPTTRIDRENPAVPPTGDSTGMVGLVGQLATAIGEGLQTNQAGEEEAHDQENETRKRRRRPKW